MLQLASEFSAAAILLLVLAYGVGAPYLLLRTALGLGKRRRLRYRSKHDDAVATSRFTIPVSLIAPVDDRTDDPSRHVRRLLQLRYPELELIVVISDGRVLEDFKQEWSLSAAEVFYRKSLAGAPVYGLYRSGADPRLIVVQTGEAGRGAAVNCGVNLARYRYLAIVEAVAAYDTDALLEAMQAALEDPQRVVGATTSVTVRPVEGIDAALRGDDPVSPLRALRYLAAARTRLATVARRRLDLPPDGCPGFTIWRRDAVLDVGGFEQASTSIQADMTFRIHAHFGGNRRYRIVHVAEPVGVVDPEDAERLAREARVPASLLWRHRRLFFNPRFGRLGVLDLPRYAFNLLVAPWFELLALLLLVVAVPLGVLTVAQLLLVLLTLGLGSGIVAATALLLTDVPGHDPRPSALFTLLLVGPVEYFVSRPAMLLAGFRRQ